MARKQNYFMLGVFILSAMVLLTAAIIILGAGSLFKSTLPAETYFDESVEGLDIGAPVKLRGVQIGSVSRIGFITDKYMPHRNQATGQDTGHYVLVEMALDEDIIASFAEGGVEELKRNISVAMDRGLRIRLTTQGLTGVSFLEIDYLDPALNPMLPISWRPEYLYFPSTFSTMSRIENAINDIAQAMEQLKSVNFKQFMATLDDFFENLNRSLAEANVKDIGELLVLNLAEARKGFARINELLQSTEIESIIPDASATMAGIRTIVSESQSDVIALFKELRDVADKLQNTADTLDLLLGDPALKESAKALPGTFEHVQEAALSIRRSGVQLERLLMELNDLAAGQSSNVGAILEEARQLLDTLNAFVGDAEQNPARILFGEPPTPIQTEDLP